ncbi:extracellular solute-binding protein [Gracilibacillus alcaliphilus]|uniref:extracellular solute-binding protein n=1 Tax=Gracilibacillus alcaliphilus TaxID=1401441 RepID=UPI001958C183|nr:extracellular solute-binding protein [Gracilibacillus alcaliphilus]MBM7677262.1 putative aldouronate transport system substrate-binding protein [Gracilibacillus alcaliphilus]
MKRKISTSVWIILIGIIFLTACNADSDNQESAGSADESDIAINETGFPIVDEPLDMTMMGPGTGLAEWADMAVLQEYQEMTNIHFTFDTPPLSDFQTKLNLAFASGDVKDVIYGAGSDNLTPGMEVDYGEQGILLPLEDLIEEHAPNIQKLFEEDPDVKKSVTTLDGHIYSLPRVSRGPTAAWALGPMWYNGEWLDALGVKELPKTTDEFYELLKRFKEEDPNGNGEADEIPLIDTQERHTRLWLMGAFGLKEWGIEEVDGTVRYTPITENYREYLAYMHKLYDEGLLDPETFAQTNEQKTAKGQNNQVGVFQAWFSFFTTGQSEAEAMNNPMFQPLVSDLTDEPVIPRNTTIGRGTFSITKDNPNPEAAIRWIDYFYSQEGFDFLAQGPEGYLWEWDNEEEGTKTWFEAPEGYETTEDYRGTLTPNYGISAPGLVVPITGKEDSDFDKFIKAETAEKVEPYAEVPFPLVYLSNEEQAEINSIEVDLQSYVEQMEAKFITGVEPLSKWDAYVETIENMNIGKYVEVHQAAYDRWAAN